MSQILLVDDDPDVAGTLREILSVHGLSATTTGSGEEALDLLSAESFDLVLLDARLPGISGFETCGRIRERFGASLPVVILTAFGDAKAVREGYEAGADDFCSKPVDTPTFILKVRGFLRLKALHDESVRNREEAQARVRNLALLHEIGRDWSLIDEPEEFNRMVTQRLADLIGAKVCLIALFDPMSRVVEAALPVHGVSDEVARGLRYEVKPEHRQMLNFASGRPYLSNRARSDTRLVQDLVSALSIESVVLVPMMSGGKVLGLLVAANKPGGFSEGDVQVLSIFAGPAATFLRSRQIFSAQKRHAARRERLWDLMAAIASTEGRAALLQLTVGRIQKDLGYERVEFHAAEKTGELRLDLEAGAPRPPEVPDDPELLKWAFRGAVPIPARPHAAVPELALPVCAGDRAFGVLSVLNWPPAPFPEEEVNLLSALASHLAVALQKAESTAETESLARQMATLYDIGLEVAALQDLKFLFTRTAEESGRLLKAHHASVFRLDPADETLRMFAAWAKDPSRELTSDPTFELGEGIAGRVARDGVPALHNEPWEDPDFVPKGTAVARLLCVPLSYYDQDRGQTTIFGVLNVTRGPGAPPFTNHDLEFATRFAGQLSIAVSNSMAFAAEHQRSEQLAFINALIREIAGNLSRERILEVAVRRIQETFRYRVAMIVSHDPEKDAGRIAAVAGAHRPGEGWRGLGPEGIVQSAAKKRAAVLLPGAFPGAPHQAAIPIMAVGDVEAVLVVEGEGPVGRGELITLETLAEGIGIILRNAELYQALERTNAMLVELDRTKSELVNIVAHDFRAPLAGVLGYAELLEWKPDLPKEERVEQARAIIHAATHMANLVDKTLKTTRLETGHFPFDFGIIDLAATLRGVVARFRTTDLHVLVAEIPEDPVPCRADRDRIAEVAENLLSNSVKYTPAGGRILLKVTTDRETATVSVSDQGLGIAPEDMKRLFRPFSRIRTPATATIEGSGLGLYICERIIRAHGGTVRIESQPGKGSTCTFSIPVFGVTAQTRPPLVLIATVDEQTRREIRRVAQDLGYAAHEVADGVEAMEAALRLLPTVAVLDRLLPRLRAEEVAERLCDHESTATIPLIGLGVPDELGASADRFRAWIPKPVDRILLATTLGTIDGSRAPGILAPGSPTGLATS
jgi:signal transduction histidine kinase/DNA-binding response OmpR family regulator